MQQTRFDDVTMTSLLQRRDLAHVTRMTRKHHLFLDIMAVRDGIAHDGSYVVRSRNPVILPKVAQNIDYIEIIDAMRGS
jgi:hypothetical protein